MSDTKNINYEDTDRLARYVEASWGDHFSSPPKQRKTGLSFDVRTVGFYKEMAKLIGKTVPKAKRIADIGAATGRMTYELQGIYSNASFLVCDLSRRFVDFGAAIMTGEAIPKFVPIVATNAQKFTYVETPPKLFDVSKNMSKTAKIEFVACKAEQIAYPDEYFDLTLCLNVVCRHPHPLELVKHCAKLTAKDGYVCLASPFDWEDSPAPEGERFYTIKDCLSSNLKPVKLDSLEYVFRTSENRLVQYRTEIVIARKL